MTMIDRSLLWTRHAWKYYITDYLDSWSIPKFLTRISVGYFGYKVESVTQRYGMYVFYFREKRTGKPLQQARVLQSAPSTSHFYGDTPSPQPQLQLQLNQLHNPMGTIVGELNPFSTTQADIISC